jgi:hypothetical protein
MIFFKYLNIFNQVIKLIMIKKFQLNLFLKLIIFSDILINFLFLLIYKKYINFLKFQILKIY